MPFSWLVKGTLRKLTELALNANERKAIVADIFVSEVTRERGLTDRATELDFDNDLAEQEQVWNDRYKAARQTSVPEFHSWFVRYQDKDMKEMLLYPVRRDAGLGYDFYYNNNPESVHRNIKARQNYKATEMPTVVENIRKEKNANLCYVEDAVIGNGPFESALEFTHFNTDQSSWTYHWSQMQKKEPFGPVSRSCFYWSLAYGISKPRANDGNQKDEPRLLGREDGQQEEGGKKSPDKTHSF